MMALYRTRGTLNRRELLIYSFLLTLLLFGAVSVVAMAWSAWPEPDYIRVGHINDFPPDLLRPGIYPLSIDDINLYLVNTGSEILAFDGHTPFDRQRCLFEWIPMTGRFEDPCSGSKFAPDGTRLQGPATRDLDRLPLKIEADQIWVDPSIAIEGTTYAEYMTCLERYDRPGVSCWPTD